MKSIRTKMMVVVCILVAASLILVGGTVSLLMYNSSMTTLEKTMVETARVASNFVYEYLETYKTVANEAGLVTRLSSSEVPISEKISIIDAKVKQYGFLSGNIVDINGKGLLYNVDISDYDYFKVAQSGQTSVSNVIKSKPNDQYIFIVSAPLWEDGIANTKVTGVVYFNIDAKKLSDMTNKINIGNTGSAYILDKDNYTIAHKDIQLVLNRDNTQESLPTDKGLTDLAKIEKKMTAGETGFDMYQYNGGMRKISAYAPIESGQGWSIAVTAQLDEFIQSTLNAIEFTIALVLVSIIIGIAASILLANSLTKPIIKIQKVAIQMAKGNFDVEITHQSCDEIGSLANSMRQMIDTTKAVLADMSRGLAEIAEGNFDIRPRVEYIGVFKGIEGAMFKIIGDLSTLIFQIKRSTDQISSGSDQVSSGAQALAQGATEQASSIQELSAAINEVSQQIQNNADNAAITNNLAMSAGGGLVESNRQMTDMISAMAEISEASSQISRIIKTIEDIAFQTNILALNAAVEAARAGSAGKGFAVVADEVRNLAIKSSAAAKKTNALIESSVKSVERGVKIADETAKSLVVVVAGAEEMAQLIAKISQACREQSTAISQINLGVEQISSVVQTNSATSEESAAASEELNGQANMLKDLIGSFKLMQGNDENLMEDFVFQSKQK